jgi:glycerol-3-phosphate responsive antiterminator
MHNFKFLSNKLLNFKNDSVEIMPGLLSLLIKNQFQRLFLIEYDKYDP